MRRPKNAIQKLAETETNAVVRVLTTSINAGLSS
ncbi:hypothetical protein X738_02015 [Mesorhizobium sp. LNHC209A00]|nr:hypothetical protein X738_02015 [Mesorhizobium sp. LNHC209A00]